MEKYKYLCININYATWLLHNIDISFYLKFFEGPRLFFDRCSFAGLF